MKKFALSLILSLVSCFFIPVSAEIIQEGNTFKSVKTENKASENTKTQYTWEDSKGNKYPIYKSKKGAFYIIKVSGKTGKEYKYYLKGIKEKLK